MKKAVAVAGALIGFAVLARRLLTAGHGVEWRKKALEHWERAFERMPDSAPPKWMFHNITAIRRDTAVARHNTDRILDLLQRGASGSGAADERSTGPNTEGDRSH